MYAQILPAEGWFYRFKGGANFGILPLAGWGVLENGDVIGLVATGVASRLPGAPPALTHATSGTDRSFIHSSQMSEADFECVKATAASFR
ncbi:hypothetical protein LO909_000121 [Aeromonas hydrophila]|nr:hypothetical protein [Aeromonas hydrophila]